MARNPMTSALSSTQGCDHSAVDAVMLADVLEGLSRPQKSLSPKYFYDERGSRLFERICEQPEYYVPVTETALLRRHQSELAAFCGPQCVILEPGAGTGEKTQILLRALNAPAAYVPIEISQTALDRCVDDLHRLQPELRVLPLCADFTRPFAMPRFDGLEWRRRMMFLPGSTIGNFDPADACRLLAEWKTVTGPRGGLVIGVDLRKPRAVLERAYDDAAGVTADFNLNLLERLNRELGANFNLQAFTHRALFNDELGRIEMHLVSTRPQRVSVGGRSFTFQAGETLHTENSYKYRPADFAELALEAGWVRRELWIDDGDLFSVQCFDAV